VIIFAFILCLILITVGLVYLTWAGNAGDDRLAGLVFLGGVVMASSATVAWAISSVH
jgi:hypothetical protein